MFFAFGNMEITALESIKVIWSQNGFTKIIKKVFRGHKIKFLTRNEGSTASIYKFPNVKIELDVK